MDPQVARQIDTIQLYVQLGLYAMLYFVGVPLFVIRRRYDPIRERGWLLAFLQVTFCLGDIAFRAAGGVPPCIMNVINVCLTVPVWLYPYFIRSFVIWYRFRLQEMMLKEQTNSPMFKRLRWIQRNPWIISSPSQAVVFFILLALGTISGILIYYTNDFTTRCWTAAEFNLVIAEAAILAFLLVIAIINLWTVTDAYLIKQELTIIVAVGIPVLILWAIGVTLRWRGGYSPSLWSTTLELVTMLVTIWMPLVASYKYSKLISRKRRPAGDRASIASSGTIDDELKVVITDTILQASFEQFTLSAWAIENLKFFRRVEEYRCMDDKEREVEAKKLGKDFILPGAIYELNLDDNISTELKKRLKEGEATLFMFDAAERHCLNLLRYSVFPLWKSSVQLRDLLKKHKVKDLSEWKPNQMNGKTGPRGHSEDQVIVSIELEHH